MREKKIKKLHLKELKKLKKKCNSEMTKRETLLVNLISSEEMICENLFRTFKEEVAINMFCHITMANGCTKNPFIEAYYIKDNEVVKNKEYYGDRLKNLALLNSEELLYRQAYLNVRLKINLNVIIQDFYK